MKMNHVLPAVLAASLFASTGSHAQVDPSWLRSWNEAQEGRPASPASTGRIAPEDAPGQPMVIRGQIVSPDGGPAAGVWVHAYHRDHAGYEFGPGDDSLTTWELQGWARTDVDGRFEFHTIRPAPDHLGREGAHIHFTTESPDHGRQWAPKVFFADDPLVTASERRRSEEAGKFGWVRAVERVDGVEYIDVLIQLKEQADF